MNEAQRQEVEKRDLGGLCVFDLAAHPPGRRVAIPAWSVMSIEEKDAGGSGGCEIRLQRGDVGMVFHVAGKLDELNRQVHEALIRDRDDVLIRAASGETLDRLIERCAGYVRAGFGEDLGRVLDSKLPAMVEAELQRVAMGEPLEPKKAKK